MEQKQVVPLSKAWEIYRRRTATARLPRFCGGARKTTSKKVTKSTLKKAA